VSGIDYSKIGYDAVKNPIILSGIEFLTFQKPFPGSKASLRIPRGVSLLPDMYARFPALTVVHGIIYIAFETSLSVILHRGHAVA
jgi:hypothetical protein